MRGAASVLGAVVTAAVALGCAEPEVETQRQASQSAVMNATAGGLIVPAYFSADSGGDASFAQIAAGHQSELPEIAIVNAGCDASGNVNPQTGGCLIGGGPGPTRSTYVHDKIAYLRARGIKVFGYVWAGRVTTNGKTAYRSSDDIVADMRAWAHELRRRRQPSDARQWVLLRLRLPGHCRWRRPGGVHRGAGGPVRDLVRARRRRDWPSGWRALDLQLGDDGRRVHAPVPGLHASRNRRRDGRLELRGRPGRRGHGVHGRQRRASDLGARSSTTRATSSASSTTPRRTPPTCRGC